MPNKTLGLQAFDQTVKLLRERRRQMRHSPTKQDVFKGEMSFSLSGLDLTMPATIDPYRNLTLSADDNPSEAVAAIRDVLNELWPVLSSIDAWAEKEALDEPTTEAVVLRTLEMHDRMIHAIHDEMRGVTTDE
jgi:hypothetical protein